MDDIESLKGSMAGIAAVLSAVIRSLKPETAREAAAHLAVAAEIDGEEAEIEGLSAEREAARKSICEAYLGLLRARAHG